MSAFVVSARLLFTSASSTISRATAPRNLPQTLRMRSSFHSSTKMAQTTVNSQFIHDVTKKENEITGHPEPAKGGPTAQAQKHTGEALKGNVVSDITKGETKITAQDGPVAGGPAAFAESLAAKSAAGETHSGKLDSETISRITHAESQLTGQAEPIAGGPTAQAQKHAGEPINSQTLHDITEGEKKVAGDRVKGGPTATAQSELSKSRS